ncbi:GspH/FimT family pseudopilin [Chromobacterium sp. ATCC 53434]|uniref:GspH/FimT family pseudopilin n=1 Tax=Chromobacterium sp. (strain ATCC 53434 / SC 14030) TaxID=2059672 RepID=UPI0013052AAB|nr:GspH/FimT family pseudopilin [Chromobacterium sp. ATCC 53434]
MDEERGFTLLELLIVMALLGLVLAFAVPAYQRTVATNALLSESGNLYGDVLFARSEAIKRGQVVLVCPSSNGASCNGSGGNTNWATGWIVLAAANNSCGDTGGTVLRLQKAFSSGDSATYSNGTNPALCFNRMGYAPAANVGMLTFNTADNLAANRRCLALAAAGHPQLLSSGQTDATGQFSCP